MQQRHATNENKKTARALQVSANRFTNNVQKWEEENWHWTSYTTQHLVEDAGCCAWAWNPGTWSHSMSLVSPVIQWSRPPYPIMLDKSGDERGAEWAQASPHSVLKIMPVSTNGNLKSVRLFTGFPLVGSTGVCSSSSMTILYSVRLRTRHFGWNMASRIFIRTTIKN